VVGTVIIGQSQGPIGSWLNAYHLLYPNVRIALEQAAPPVLLDGVRNGRLDIALASVAPSHDPPGLTVVRRDEVPLGIACPVGHPLAERASTAAGELRDELFVTVAPSHPAAPLAESFWTAVGARSVVQAADAQSTLDLVAQGFGLALMPRTWALTRGDVRWLELARDAPKLAFGVVISERPPSIAVQALLKHLRGTPHLLEP
jgi:DNA-binding transcriptional LysR family regulator